MLMMPLLCAFARDPAAPANCCHAQAPAAEPQDTKQAAPRTELPPADGADEVNYEQTLRQSVADEFTRLHVAAGDAADAGRSLAQPPVSAHASLSGQLDFSDGSDERKIRKNSKL